MAVAVLRQRRSNSTSFTCADGTAIPKGTLLALTDPRTAIQNSTSGSVLAGICARDKVANSGITEVDVFTDGIFDMTFSGSGIIGLAVMGSTASQDAIEQASPTERGREILGHTLESPSDGEVVQVELNIGGGGNQIT